MSRSRRGDARAKVLSQLRQLEALCASQTDPAERSYFATLARLLDVLGVAFEGTRDPAVLLTVVATLAGRQAESMLLSRVEAWRGMSTGIPSG